MIKLKTLLFENNKIPIYRGLSAYNKNGRYYTINREWARQFTQSGRDKEIITRFIDARVIYKKDPLPKAYDETEFDVANEEAANNGFKAVWYDEGMNEPLSIYVIDKTALS